jgi:hypothetical protein
MHPPPPLPVSRGFALIAVLALAAMVTLLTLALLALAAGQGRVAASAAAQAAARANARLALSVAVGDLQRLLGPDGRVSVPADLDWEEREAEGHPHRHWTGVYEAWDAERGLLRRPEPAFVGWLASAAQAADRGRLEFARERGAGEIPLVGAGTLGAAAAAAGAVASPAVELPHPLRPGRLAWWVADEAQKASVVPGAGRAPALAGPVAAALLAANAGAGGGAAALAALGPIEAGDPRRAGLLDSGQLALANPLAGSLFHDVTPFSRGLAVDVTRRRMKFDFSTFALLERGRAANLPLYKADGEVNRFHTSAGGLANGPGFELFNGGPAAMMQPFGNPAAQPGINLEELWIHANLYRTLVWNNGVPGLLLMNGAESASPDFRHRALADPWFNYAKPVFAAVQFVFSFVAKPDPAAAGKFRMQVQMDALVKIWNPNNVRVEVPAGASFVVQLLAVPFKVQWQITRGAGTVVLPQQSALGNNTYAFAYGPWASSGNVFGQRSFQWLRGNIGGLAQSGVSTGYTLEPGECKVFGYDKDLASSSWTGDPNVNLAPGWGPGRQALIVANFGANALEADDMVEFIVSPDNDAKPSNVRTYCNKWIGHRAGGSQASGGNGGLALGNSSISTSVDFANPDPQWFPEARSSQRLRVSQYATPKPFMIFGHYLNVEQPAAGTRDAFASAPRLLSGPAITARRTRSLALDQLTSHQEVWRCDPLPLAYDSPLIDITSQDRGRFGGGHSALTGVTRCATRQLDPVPPQSLMSLSHAIANGFADRFGQASERAAIGVDVLQSDGLGGNYKFEPGDIAFSTVTYAAPRADRVVGESFPTPFVALDRVGGSGGYHAATGNAVPLFDHSYLANAALFDSWFCSGLFDGGKFPAGLPIADPRGAAQVLREFLGRGAGDPAKRLLNPRVLPAGDPAAARERLLAGSALRPEALARLAAHVFLDGAFNVNSTRVDAWQALLTTARDHAKLLDGKPLPPPLRGAVFGSSGLAAAGAAAPSDNPAEIEQWSGFRALDDTQIERLAREIVARVKTRGPFLSLADFLNRRPADPGEARLLGVVQAAIEAAGLNDPLKAAGRTAAPADFGNLPGADMATAGGGLARSAGIPGYLMQSDLLAPVANQLAARGDTFRVRCYGAATDRAGRVIAEARGEAIVQRLPEFLDPADPADLGEEELTRPANRLFGRRFRIVHFHWLPPDSV